MKIKSLLLLCAIVTISAGAFAADDDPTGPISETVVRELLSRQGFNGSDSDQIIASLKGDNGRVALSGALFTSGGNGAFILDNDNWNFDGAIMQNGHLAKIHNMFDVYFWNGGFNAELSYKWIWIFLPSNTSIDNLDGEIFGGPILGRGIGLKTNVVTGSPIFVQGGWVKNDKTGESIYILAAGVDILSAGGALSGRIQINNWKINPSTAHFSKLNFTFPKLKFTQKQIARPK